MRDLGQELQELQDLYASLKKERDEARAECERLGFRNGHLVVSNVELQAACAAMRDALKSIVHNRKCPNCCLMPIKTTGDCDGCNMLLVREIALQSDAGAAFLKRLEAAEAVCKDCIYHGYGFDSIKAWKELKE